MISINKPRRDFELIVVDGLINLDTGEKMEARFFYDELTPHNIPESWKRVKVVLKDDMLGRVI